MEGFILQYLGVRSYKKIYLCVCVHACMYLHLSSFLSYLQQSLLPKEALTPLYWHALVTASPLSPGTHCWCNGLRSWCRHIKQPVKVSKHSQMQLPKRTDFLKTPACTNSNVLEPHIQHWSNWQSTARRLLRLPHCHVPKPMANNCQGGHSETQEIKVKSTRLQT